MRGFLGEVVFILTISRRTRWALALGPISFFTILIVGEFQLQDFQFQGMLAPYTEYFREKILRRYDKAAWFCLASFWILAFKLYRKDKKKFDSSF